MQSSIGDRQSRILPSQLKPPLSRELLSRDKWKPDQNVTQCDHCTKTFNVLYRRKHHCRRCGYVFCAECSDYFMTGDLFSTEGERKVRFCGKCHDHLNRLLEAQGGYIRKSGEQLSRSDLDTIEVIEQQHEDLEFDPEANVPDVMLLMPDEQERNDQLELLLKERSSEQMEKICEFVLKQMQFKQEQIEYWKPIMTNFVRRAIKDIKLQSLNNDFMDINCYVKKKIIVYHDHSLTAYIKGLVFRKNVALKNMSTDLFRPYIMIIMGSLDIHDNIDNQFEDFLTKEKRTLNELVEKIMSFRPNIILIEKSINKQILDMLHKVKVTVVLNIKQQSLRRIAQCTGCKHLKLEKLDEHIKMKRQLTGACERIQFRSFPKTNNKDNTLMYIQTADGDAGVTLTLSGPNYEVQKYLKKGITGCLRIAKHFDVEISMIMTEMKLKKSMVAPHSGDFSKFLFEKLSRTDFMRADLTYIKINYVKADIHNFNDIKDWTSLQKYQQDYRSKEDPKIINYFAQMCNIPVEKKQASFHSQDDISLGAFILLKIVNMDKRCESCRLPRYDHVSVYYSTGKFIKVSIDNKFQLPYDLSLKKQTSQISDGQVQEIFLLKDLPTILQSKQQQIRIETYVECAFCEHKFSEVIPLSQQNMEYSFLRFLQHLFMAPTHPAIKKVPCDHCSVQRVFLYEQTAVKVSVGEFQVYSVTLLSFLELQDAMKTWEKERIKTKKEELLVKVENLAQMLFNQIPKELNKDNEQMLRQQINQLKDEFIKALSEQFTTFFEVDLKQQEYGVKFKVIHQLIIQQKKRREPELNSLIQHYIQQNQQIISKTAQDLDRFSETMPERIQQDEINGHHAHSQNGDYELVHEVGDLPVPPFDANQSPYHKPLTSQSNLDNVPLTHAEFNFQKEWNLCGFITEQEKIINKKEHLHPFVPIFEGHALSYVAFTLNHKNYLNDVYNKEGFGTQEVGARTEEAKKFFANILLPKAEDVERQRGITQVDLKNDKDCFVMKIFYDQQKQEKSPHLQAAQPFTKSELDPQMNSSISNVNVNATAQQHKRSKYAEILIYFPAQFEAIRMLNGVSLSQFIKSISSTVVWNAQGGKSQSTFYKSHDELFIFKKLEQEKEFLMFKKFALNYFKHLYRHIFDSKPSLLCKIFGMVEIRDRGSIEYLLVMENLLYGMGTDINVYDLKGSETNRWEKKKKAVLLDTNFKVDRNSEPIPIVKEHYPYIDRAFQIDCKFLHKHHIIDYSLLLIIDNKTLKLRMGIIDYMRFYTWDKESEHYLKYLLKGGMVPTIVNPTDYKKRFIDVMQKYFVAV